MYLWISELLLRFTLVWNEETFRRPKALDIFSSVHFQNVDKLGKIGTDWSIVFESNRNYGIKTSREITETKSE